MQNEIKCVHKYYIVKHLVTAEPYALILGETEEQRNNPTYMTTGADNVFVVCRNCYHIKNIND